MEELIIIGIILIILVLLKVIFQINFKKIKQLAENMSLDEEVKKYPRNEEICKIYLKKLNNENVIIQEDKTAENTMYIAVSNKILIANLRESFTRIQTIAHECLHSIQNRRILLFNHWFSIFYLLYYVVILLLIVLEKLPYSNLALIALIIFSFVYYMIRSYLENDAMIKAKYLAKQYLEEVKLSSKEKIDEIINAYEEINQVGIPLVNYNLFFNCMIKVLIFVVLMILF